MTIDEMEKWIWNTLEHGLDKQYTYHNTQHTSSVLRDLKVMMAYYELNRQERRLLKTAALFHDLAFIKSHINHEEESAKIAEKELPQYGFTKEEVEAIKGMIMATRIPQSPKNFLEELLCDADLFYLGGDNYFEIAAGLKKEWENVNLISGERAWLATQLKFLKNHNYHTSYAQLFLAPGKRKVISELELQLARLDN